jgi:hypothetical protein
VTDENEGTRLPLHVNVDEGALINFNLFFFDHFGRDLLLCFFFASLSFSSNLSFSFGLLL